MYFEKDLSTQWMPQVRWPNGDNVNLAVVRDAIQEQADENGIPVAFGEDQVKVSGLFNWQMEDVLLMYNPEHPRDYLRFVIRVKHQGKYAFMQVYNMGGSKNFRDISKAEEYDAKDDWVGGLGRKLMNSVTGVNSKVQEEENYYTILRDCLENATGV